MSRAINFINAFSHVKYEELKSWLNSNRHKNLADKSKDTLKELKLNGVVTIENYYSEDLCNQLKNEIDRLILDENVNVWKDDTESDYRIFASHLHSKLIQEFHNDSFLAEVGSAYLNCPIVNSHTLGARLQFKEGNKGSGGGWHRDSVFTRQYKSIIYLTDVDENNGPFEYLLGTHEKRSIYESIFDNNFKAHHNRFTQKEIDDFLKTHPQYTAKLFTAKKGTVILVDTSGIHRGTPIKSTNNRYALTNYFYPTHLYTEKLKKKFEVNF